MSQPLISPTPEIVGEEPPHIGAGLRFMDAPTEYLKELRQRHGDTFLVDIFGFELFLTFSAQGLESLYQLEEEKASFGLATYDLVGFKTPVEVLMDADIQLFYELLRHKNMSGYIDLINRISDSEFQRWGDSGKIEWFDAIRTLEQRIGYGLWIAEEAAGEAYWPKLKEHFDVLDQERSFVDPREILNTIKTNKARERDAIQHLTLLIGEILDQREQTGDCPVATLDLLRERFSTLPAEEQRRKIIHNAINANQGFLSNLYAAIAWVLINLQYHPETKEKVLQEIETTRKAFGDDFLSNVEALNAMAFMEQVMMESIRLAQRSLTLRKVLQPVNFNDGNTTYTVQPGVYIATMLSVTNTQTEELARFDPEHFDRNKLIPSLPINGKHSISTFGHGKHACPAQRFSHHMCKIVVSKLLTQFDLEMPSDKPEPSEQQMGGVARPNQDISVHYRRKS